MEPLATHAYQRKKDVDLAQGNATTVIFATKGLKLRFGLLNTAYIVKFNLILLQCWHVSGGTCKTVDGDNGFFTYSSEEECVEAGGIMKPAIGDPLALGYYAHAAGTPCCVQVVNPSVEL